MRGRPPLTKEVIKNRRITFMINEIKLEKIQEIIKNNLIKYPTISDYIREKLDSSIDGIIEKLTTQNREQINMIDKQAHTIEKLKDFIESGKVKFYGNLLTKNDKKFLEDL